MNEFIVLGPNWLIIINLYEWRLNNINPHNDINAALI